MFFSFWMSCWITVCICRACGWKGLAQGGIYSFKNIPKSMVKNKNIALPIKIELPTVCKHINVQMKKHYLLSTNNIWFSPCVIPVNWSHWPQPHPSLLSKHLYSLSMGRDIRASHKSIWTIFKLVYWTHLHC